MQVWVQRCCLPLPKTCFFPPSFSQHPSFPPSKRRSPTRSVLHKAVDIQSKSLVKDPRRGERKVGERGIKLLIKLDKFSKPGLHILNEMLINEQQKSSRAPICINMHCQTVR